MRTTSEQIARKKKKQIEGFEVAGQLDLPTKTPIVPFIKAFCKHQRLRSTHTSYRADISYLRSFFGPICEPLEPIRKRKKRPGHNDQPDFSMSPHAVPVRYLEEITPTVVNHFIAERISQDGISAKTVNRLRGLPHAMFDYAIRHHAFTSTVRGYRNPIGAVERQPEAAPRIRFLGSVIRRPRISLLMSIEHVSPLSILWRREIVKAEPAVFVAARFGSDLEWLLVFVIEDAA